MCGIAGIVGAKEDHRIDREMIHRMCQTIVHRGPDDEGIFTKDGAGLGMRRLSIIDLSGGQQPIFNENGTCWVVFNGEIYNFLQLRSELESKGHRFSTRSDTEVIVHLYEEMGVDCVRKLRGMFSFALFDEHRRRLLLGRDRLGKKPLHYAFSKGRLLFASEIKAILAVAPELVTVNSQALLQYFYFGYIPDPLSAFSYIHKLPPGHILEFEKDQVGIRQYWELPEYGTYSPKSEEECLDQLEQLLRNAVHMRMTADVPLGALLSGGTDSSTIVALMAQASSKSIKTFSIGFKDSDHDESPYAKMVAKKFGTEHHELILEPDVVETVQTLASSLEEPFGDSSMLPTYFVCSLARKYVTVVLSGDGGDELFAGYDRYRQHMAHWLAPAIPQWMGKVYRNRLFHTLKGARGRNVAYSLTLPWHERYIESVSLAPYQRNFSVLSDDFATAASDGKNPNSSFSKFIATAPASDSLSRILFLDTKTYLPGDILTKVDRMSMAISLEARVPLLDHILVEWVTSLDSKWKLNRRGQKYILVNLAKRLGVPNTVLNRPKQGFALPLVHWMRSELKEFVLDLLLDARTAQRGYFNLRGVRSLLDAFFAGRTDDYLIIWRLLMFELWQRNFLEPFQEQQMIVQHNYPCWAVKKHA